MTCNMHINSHTYYSLRYGTLSIDRLLELAVKNKANVLALTDINTSMGIPEFVRKAKQYGIKPVSGIEFRNGDDLIFIGIARNNDGFKELNDYLTYHNLNKKEFYQNELIFNNVLIIYPLGYKNPADLKDYEYTGIRPDQVNLLMTSPYHKYQNKLVILNTITFEDNHDYFLHRSLRAIEHNTLISKLKAGQFARQKECMISVSHLNNIFKDYPIIIRNTEELMDNCCISFDYTTVKNKKTFTNSRYEDRLLLEKLAMDGMVYRYGKNNDIALQRIRHELQIIDKLNFSSYFLITRDIVSYSMSRGIYHVGRGSGANSIVAYCLKITDVDPIALNLYFERFLNIKRSEPPDFDIDYSWKDRDKVLKYIFSRYGEGHVALLGAMSTFKNKSIFRELGKVFGLPRPEIDMMIKDPSNENNNNDIVRKIIALSHRMTGFPNQRTIHAGGVLISEKPLSCYTALDLPPKGFPTTQWDMYIASEMKFEKIDILSQRGLGHIHDAVEIVMKNRGVNINIHCVQEFFNDEKIKKLLREGETNGCFYIESPGMRGLLRKLCCDNYLSLVAASSIIRPGVAKSGMMREYISRFHHPHDFKYIHPVMKQQLSETYGIMVYQEDVMKVAHHFAGLDLTDADVLRRAISGKYRSSDQLLNIEKKYFENCRKFGYSESVISEVWRQMKSFAGYSFCKAHSASYAVESFQSLYLKAHYPLEFQVAVINNFGGFYPSWVYFNEARRFGGIIELPCVNHSKKYTMITGKTIYIGFIHVENLEKGTISLIEEERKNNGKFSSLYDFMERVSVKKEQLIILIRIGALRFTGEQKAGLLWESHLYLKKTFSCFSEPMMFSSPLKKFELPPLEHSRMKDAYDEIELLGFTVSIDPFEMLKTGFRGETGAKGLMDHVGSKVRMVGCLVTVKYVRTVRHEIMGFGTFIDSSGEFFDTVHFPFSLKNYSFRGEGIYLILGRVTEEFGLPSVETEKMAKLPYKTEAEE